MAIVINDVAPRVRYTATAAQETFTVPFEFMAITDLKVYRNGNLLTYDATPVGANEYSVTGTGVSGGGTISLGSPYATLADDILILRDMPIDRLTDFAATGAFPISSLNEELDAIIAKIQQVEVYLERRALRLATTDLPESMSALPVKATRASKLLGFDADGNPDTSNSVSSITALSSQYADEAEASAAAALVSENNASTSAAAAAASATLALDGVIDWQGQWVTATAYAYADTVSNLGSSYYCIVAHTSGASTQPGVGASWETRWVLLAEAGTDGTGAGDMLAANNLSELTNPVTARLNLGLEIGVDVQAYSSNLAGWAAVSETNYYTITELNANFQPLDADLSAIAALGDPNADRILFWDDSAGAFKYLEVGSGLAITGTQITSTGTDGSGARTFYRYVATAGQTTFTGADANALTLAYTVGKIDVHVNGRLISSDDYTASSTTSVVFDSGLTVGDEVIITAYSGVLNLTAWTAASASGPASLAFAEDTDNGAHTVTLKAPASVTASVDVTLPNEAGTLEIVRDTGPLAGFRNHLLNGAMMVAQRATSFVSGANNDDTYNLDRWIILSDGNDIVDITQSTEAPTGGLNSIALDVETVNKKFGILQIIEQKNCIGLIGNTVTLSFKAKVSSVTKLDNLKAAIISWTGTADAVTSDIVSAWGAEDTNPTLVANWTYENTPVDLNPTTSWATYSVSAAIDTASTKNIAVFIWSDVTDTTLGDFLYITDVQLEVGAVATTFERRSYSTELGLCLRYYEKEEIIDYRMTGSSGGDIGFRVRFAQRKFSTPTVTAVSVAYLVNASGLTFAQINSDGFSAYWNSGSSVHSVPQFGWNAVAEL
jgi:hypothetical protein